MIVFDRIDKLEILRDLFTEVIITEEVAKEYHTALPIWIKIIVVQNRTLLLELNQKVDLGEASAITLATELYDSTIILDDYKARELAKKLGLRITGTLGIVIKAKEMGVIDKVKPLLDMLVSVGFRLNERIYFEVLKISDEE